MSAFDWIAAGYITFLVGLLVVYIAVLSRGLSVRTDRHRVGVYHGNWAESWHTPLQANIMSICGALFFIIATFCGLLLAILSS